MSGAPTSSPMDLMREAISQAQAGRIPDAIATVGRALAAEPAHAPANGLMGTLLHACGRGAEAIMYLERAHAAAPDEPRMAYQLGAILAASGQPQRGIALMRRAVDLSPDWLQGINGLANALFGAGDHEGAEATWRRSLQVQPGQAEPLCGLGGLMVIAGRPSEAARLFREAARLHPTNVEVLGRLVSVLNYAEDAQPAEIHAAHVAWGKAIGDGTPWTPPNAAAPDRKLRIGFLSPDLYDHSCAYFLRPILAHRDRGAFEAICYSSSGRADWMSSQLRGLADQWRDVAAMPEASLIQTIRTDQIDVLLELAGHTALGPLAALRNRAAPVQATYLGYPNTTGLATMDYRIVDAITDPPGAEAWHTEKLARLDGCFLCYSPSEQAPPVRGAQGGAAADPWQAWGSAVTFGSFNSIRKLSPGVIRSWSRILNEVPDSRLLLKTRGLSAPLARRNILASFAEHGIAPERLELADMVPTKQDHLGWYHRIDVALDTFPYNGTTTTCEALWMGVPVVALEGKIHAGRVGASLLAAAGMPDLVARSEDEYVAIAARLGRDPVGIATMRAGMRARLAASPLLDAPGHSAHFYGTIRQMWRTWCASQPGTRG